MLAESDTMNLSSELRRRSSLTLSLLWVLAGCSVLENLAPSQQPRARVTGAGLEAIDLESATVRFDVAIENPSAVALPLLNLDYRLASGDAVFLTGSAELQGTVPAGGSKTVALPARVVFADLLRIVKGVRPGSVVPYSLEAAIVVDSVVAGPLRLPAGKSGELPVPVAPEIELKEIQWDRLTLGEAAGHIEVGLVNPNSFPFELSGIDYRLTLGKTQVARASLARAASLGASGGTGSVQIPISFSPAQLGVAVFRMLVGSSIDYGFEGAVAVSTPFGAMSLPIEKAGQTSLRGP